VIDKIDIVLLMSVNPGFAGQEFIPEVLPKLSEARARINAAKRDIRLAIDGGVKVENAARIARAGADTFVAGSAIFDSTDYAGTIQAMRAQIAIGTRLTLEYLNSGRQLGNVIIKE
jgi:ribulose-phosphate 3-epimerase